MNIRLIFPVAALTLFFSAHAFAQETSANTDILSSPSQPEAETESLFQQGLNAIPPRRAEFAAKIFNSREAIQELDAWIENAGYDDPKSLVVKDLLTPMPPPFAGPRIVALAKKSADPNARNSWRRWLAKYPDAYAAVLREWLKTSSTLPSQFLGLLNEYAEIQPEQAMHMWSALIQNNKLIELKQVAEFGYRQPSCASLLISALTETDDLTRQLRIQRALIRCNTPVNGETDTQPLADAVRSELDHETIAVRMVALSVLGSDVLAPAFASSFQDKVLSIYNEARNSTERSAALLILQRTHAPNQVNRLRDALENGDEALRFQAASILAENAPDALPPTLIMTAFQRELWPDTQQKLYDLLAKSMTGEERVQFQKSIIHDEDRPLNMRISAINDMFESSPGAFSLSDMNALQDEEAPVEIIATAAENLYRHNPSARPQLRQWIVAQQPFERRILSTFALFIKTDEANHDGASLDTMRAICANAPEQHNILQPCLIYMSDHAQSEDDSKLLESLQNRKNQIDAMTGMDL